MPLAIEKAEVVADSLQEQFEPNHVAGRKEFDQRIHVASGIKILLKFLLTFYHDDGVALIIVLNLLLAEHELELYYLG
ncbi:hypothetical protein TNCV_4234681 [Trichonephila clavipes]|nr:hypothetical protein TNCV_4234681 [Trichonephila clavipes]